MKKIIMLLIMTLTLFGCSDNSRNQEIQTVFEKNGFEMTRNTISYKPVTSYVMTNEAVDQFNALKIKNAKGKPVTLEHLDENDFYDSTGTTVTDNTSKFTYYHRSEIENKTDENGNPLPHDKIDIFLDEDK